MIDSIVKATEKVVELLEYRQRRAKARYENFVLPVHESMLKVHEDYLVLFQEAIQRIEEGQSLKEVHAWFTRRRLEFEAQRRDLAAKIKVFKDIEDDSLATYFHCVCGYLTRSHGGYIFPVYLNERTSHRQLRTRSFILEYWLRCLIPWDAKHVRERAIIAIERIIDDLRLDWCDVTEANARAQLEANN